MFRALADPQRRSIVELLIRGAMTQKQLRERLAINSGTLSKHMTELENAQLVVHRGGHAAYALRDRDAIRDALIAFAEVAAAITRANAEQEADRLAALKRSDLRIADPAVAAEDA